MNPPTPGNATLQRGPQPIPLTQHTHPTGQAGAWRSQEPNTTQCQPRERHAPAWPEGSPKNVPTKTEAPTPARHEPSAHRNDVPVIPPPTNGEWRSRGYIPHLDSDTVIQHVTFHLADSLPANVLERIGQQVSHLPATQLHIEQRKQAEAWIDAGHGSCILATPDAASMVQNALLHFDDVRYRLFAWVIMPNHVHALFQPIHSWSLSKIVTAWKSFTGRRLMPLLPMHLGDKQQERIWHREYWDRFIRDQNHFHAVVEYIHNNPVKAHLTDQPQHWPWSSAYSGNDTLQPGQKGSPLTEHSLPRARLEPGVPSTPAPPNATPGNATLQRGPKPTSSKAQQYPGNATLQRGPKPIPLTQHTHPTGQAGAWRSQDSNRRKHEPV
jgi:putative transposase